MRSAPLRLDPVRRLDGLRGPPGGPVPPGVDVCAAAMAHEGRAAGLVADLKYRNRRGLVGRLGRAVAVAAPVGPHAVVTWVPTVTRRRRQRGYDHAELLARVVARDRGVPCAVLLARLDDGHQVGRARAERLGAPVFVALGPVPGAVLVVDDVLTTGGTLAAAARALRAAGAERVDAAVLTRTPLKGGSPAADEQGGSRGDGGR